MGVCRTGGPRCTGEGKRRLESAQQNMVSAEADGAPERIQQARKRLDAALHEYDLTKGGLDGLEAQMAALPAGEEKAALVARYVAARDERQALLARHRQGLSAAYGATVWATPTVLNLVDELRDMQGHDPVERTLLGSITLRTSVPQNPRPLTYVSKGVNQTFECVLDDGTVAYHKPFDGLDEQAADVYGHTDAAGDVEALQPVHEAAAWQLAKQLGDPWNQIVCPCVIREVDGRLGSFSRQSLLSRKRGRAVRSDEFRAAAFFDILVGQQDRNRGNYFTDGAGGPSVSLIDHGFCFARPGDLANAVVLAKPYEGEALIQRERDVLTRLLASSGLLGMRRILEADRAAALEDRARRMLNSGVLLDPEDF